MKTSLIRKTAIVAATAIAMAGATATSSSALPLDVQSLKSTNSNVAVQTVGWTTKQKQAAGWGLAAGVLTGLFVSDVVGKKKKKNAMQMHIAYCSGKHPTYDPSTNIYMSLSGPKYCGSPYL